MTKREVAYRAVMDYFMALSSTSLLPVVYFIKSRYELWGFDSTWLNILLDLFTYLSVPVVLSILSLCWMKIQSRDSITQGVVEISPVNHEYLPVYLGYIFVSLSIPNTAPGVVDWVVLLIVYLLICLFVTKSKTLCFNPIFILLGYGYYQVKTKNGVKVFVMTKKEIRKGDGSLSFPFLRKINEMVYLDNENTEK